MEVGMRIPRMTTTLIATAFLASSTAYAVQPQKAGLETNRILEHHTFDPARQAQMTEGSAAFQRFQAAYGAGFRVDWDERSGTPLRIYGVPIQLVHRKAPQADVLKATDAFLIANGDLLGVPFSSLELSVAQKVRDTWYIKYDRYSHGVPVEGAYVELRVRSGAITMFKVDTHPGADAIASAAPGMDKHTAVSRAISALQPIAGTAKVIDAGHEVVLPVAFADHYEYHLAWVNTVSTQGVVGQWRSHVDAMTGEILRRENLVRFVDGTIYGETEERKVGDTRLNLPMPDIEVVIGGGAVNANEEGSYSSANSGTGSVRLIGKYVDVNNNAGADGQASFTANSSPADYTIVPGDATEAEISSYKHTETVKDYARRLWSPDLGWLNARLQVNVNIASTCNAYWDGSSTNFFQAGNGCNNTGRLADVVYHEFGHGYHQNLAITGTIAGDIGEGSGDITSMCITQDSRMAPGFGTGGQWIRDANNSKHYPEDLTGEPHDDGEIWSGVMWDLQEALLPRYDNDKDQVWALIGRLHADVLRSGPTFDSLYSEMLLADDDDNDLTNGTPHECEIGEVFAARGLANGGAGGGGFMPMTHDEIVGQISSKDAVSILATVGGGTSACAVDPDTVTLFYSTDGGATFTQSPMTSGANNQFSADIPAQETGTVVNYYIKAVAGTVTATTPGLAPRNLYGYYVGALKPVFFDDFETDMGWTHGLDIGDGSEGQDDWQRGTPNGSAQDPMSAYSGTNVWGNDLGMMGWNGEYQPDIKNHLESPAIDCSSCKGARLQFRRWLRVEDAEYDHARVYVNGTVVWENQRTVSGDTHRLDEHWTFYDIDISDIADGNSSVVIRFELESDPGLQFGGWTLDDVGIFVPGSESGGGDDNGPGTCSCTIGSQTSSPARSIPALVLLGLAGVVLTVRRRKH